MKKLILFICLIVTMKGYGQDFKKGSVNLGGLVFFRGYTYVFENGFFYSLTSRIESEYFIFNKTSIGLNVKFFNFRDENNGKANSLSCGFHTKRYIVMGTFLKVGAYTEFSKMVNGYFLGVGYTKSLSTHFAIEPNVEYFQDFDAGNEGRLLQIGFGLKYFF